MSLQVTYPEGDQCSYLRAGSATQPTEAEALRDDMRAVAIVLNELVNSGARVCTHAEQMEAWARADAALECLKSRYGLPAGRGDTR